MKKTISLPVGVTTLLIAVLATMTAPALAEKQYCHYGDIYESAWSFSSNAQARFVRNFTEPRNANVSQSEKERRVLKVINKYHQGLSGVITDDALAKLIVWASDCGGHDFTYFAALVEQESSMCKVRLSTSGGGDSGCGQFTSPAFNVLKNQMRLPGQQRNNNANRRAKELMEQMVQRCMQSYPLRDGRTASARTQSFIDLMSKSIPHIKGVFRNGSQISNDLVATSLYLKFLVARTGGYIIPGSAPGALASYNGKSAYANWVRNKARNVDLVCTDDSAELAMGYSACMMSDNPGACLADLEDHANGVIEL